MRYRITTKQLSGGHSMLCRILRPKDQRILLNWCLHTLKKKNNHSNWNTKTLVIQELFSIFWKGRKSPSLKNKKWKVDIYLCLKSSSIILPSIKKCIESSLIALLSCRKKKAKRRGQKCFRICNQRVEKTQVCLFHLKSGIWLRDWGRLIMWSLLSTIEYWKKCRRMKAYISNSKNFRNLSERRKRKTHLALISDK